MDFTMKNFQFVIALAMYTSILAIPQIAFAKNNPQQNCKIYFSVVEHDEQTSNLNMVGLNRPQQTWYDKHGAKVAPGLCLVNGNATGIRITVDNSDEKYIESIVGTKPFYSIAWEEHQVYVPDNQGGHYAYEAKGILSIWKSTANGGDGDFVPLSPIHDTNRTIFSSSSVSLLKYALKEIANRNGF
jgi:hypothetical protein